MNKQSLFKLLFVATVALTAFSCGEKEEEEEKEKAAEEVVKTDITSLSANKTAGIIFGEEISFSASSQGDVFDWTCSSGQIVGNGKSANWKAPDKVGKYTVTVSNGNGSTQSKELEVVGLFFDNFEKTGGWSINGESPQTVHTTVISGKVLLSNSSLTQSAYRSHDFSAGVSLPVSFKTLTAITEPQNDWTNLANNSNCQFNLYFNAPVEVNSSYINALFLVVYPKSSKWLIGIALDNGEQIVVDSGDRANFTALEQYKNIALSINADREISFFVDGVGICSTDALKTTYAGLALGNVRRFRYSVSPTVSLLMDDFCLTNDGTVLK